VCGRLERVYEDLQPRRVTRKLEQSHDTNDAEEFENVVFLFVIRKQEVEVETERGDKVDDVDGCHDKRALTCTYDEPDDQLKREPPVADALDVEESGVRICSLFFEHPCRFTK